MSELALDHDQWHTLVGHLDRVRVAELMRREPPTHTCRDRGVVQLLADPGWRARPAACRSADNAEQPTDRQTTPQLQPWREVRPRIG